jgi:hypothetical protein
MQNHPVNVATYRSSVDDYNANWRLLDQMLTGLCEANPGHSSRAAVNAKLWIIGRTYATGIERRIKTTGVQGSSMTQLAEYISTHAGLVDGIFYELRTLKEPVNVDCLRRIAGLHARFVTFLGQITAGKSARSFASKYMHFHNSVVPIYDNVAAKALSRLYPRLRGLCDFDDVPDGDAYYCWYLARFWRLHEAISACGLETRVKYVDNYLLSIADQSPERPERQSRGNISS